MRAFPPQLDDRAFARALRRLDGLPIRPSTARSALAALVDAPGPPPPGGRPWPGGDLDPGWVLARSTPDGSEGDPIAIAIARPWWTSLQASPAATEAVGRLWRHAVAVALAARRIAREAADPDPDRVAAAGLLHAAALWAVAAVDPERLARWLDADRPGRAALESRWFGTDLAAAGRRLVGLWGADPLVADAAWLHDDPRGDLNACARDPGRLAFIQAAHALARRTPWALDAGSGTGRDFGPPDLRLKILIAEVQAATIGPFVAPDASAREEALTRENLDLRRRLAASEAGRAAFTRLAANLAATSPAASPDDWAERAASAWAGEPGVAAARLDWRDPDDHLAPASDDDGPTDLGPPSSVHPLGDPARPVADLMLWADPGEPPTTPSPAVLAGWGGWARLVADRDRLARALDRAVAGHRDRARRDEAERGRGLLDGLAEFAAGAGHELNNPLAVIMGRAQLLLARAGDAESGRSLRAIIAQAQRAHRILRDLMFVARPVEPRPRACQPDEVVRACLRDLADEAEARGVRLVQDAREPAALTWADPESLRQVADILVRNALESSPAGTTIRFATGGDARRARWTVHDEGRGLTPAEGAHLFDPFFCGRQAGRGLGLGLARAARVVAQAGGEIRWHSAPGQGAAFQVTWPTRAIPPALAVGAEGQAASA